MPAAEGAPEFKELFQQRSRGGRGTDVSRVNPISAPVSPLVEVVVVLRPLNVDQLLVLLLVGLPTCDGEVLHVLQGLP